MPEVTIAPAEQNAEVVIPAPGTADKLTADQSSIKEMEAMVEKRYGKKPETAAAEPKQSDAKKPEAEKGGIQELRKSREEAIEKLKTHEKTLAEREQKLSELEKQVQEFDGTRKEYEALQKRIGEVEEERDKYKKLDSIAAWEQDTETHKKFVEPHGKAIERLKELAGLADLDPDELVAAASLTGKAKVQALDSMLEGASRFVSDDIVQTVRFLDELSAARAEELANVDQRMQERRIARENEGRKAIAERTAVRDTAWKVTTELMAKETGLSETEVAAAAEFFKTNKDAGKAAAITLKGHAYDAVKAENAALKAELAKYDKAAPKIEAGLGGGAPAKVDVKVARREMIAEVFPSGR